MDHPKSAFSWDYDTGAATRRRQEEETPVVVQPIPSRETMMKRWAFRQGVREETLQHRRIQQHGGMGDTGRNISLVLRDRERYGARGVIMNRRRPEKHQPDKPATATTSTTTEENGCTGVGVKQEQHQQQEQPQEQQQHKKQQGKLWRRVSYPMTIFNEVRTFAEYCSVIRYHSAFFHHLGGEDEKGEQGERPASSKAVSTISIAFSPDSQTMASTHGDHTVKITCCSTGRLLQTLEGHPRTPWTVKYHPTDQNVLASGCLGHQVRVWNWKEKTCLQMIRLEFAIISLSFHPGGDILAIANGTRLHFWGYGASATQEQDRNGNANNNNNNGAAQHQQPRPFRGMLTEVEQRHMLRCVHFPPDGNSIIVGGVNATTEDPRRRGRSGISGGGMSFYLRMWDFDVDAALRPFGEGSAVGLRRRAISNPRTFVPRALLYNDGGFDVSPDGKVLCACAEYWLPDGIDNAMELAQNEECSDESDDELNTDEPNADGDGAGKSAAAASDSRGSGSTTPQPGNRSSLHSPPRNRTPSQPTRNSSAAAAAAAAAASSNSGPQLTPRTPPNPSRPHFTLSPPSPPGRRFTGGLGQNRGRVSSGGALHPFPNPDTQNAGSAISPPPPPPPGMGNRPPHPLSIISGGTNYPDVANQSGRYVPHVVTISLDSTPSTQPEGNLTPGRGKVASVARGYRPRLGQLLEACPLDGAKASAVTCVKFSPSTDFCLIGYGVREPVAESGGQYHPVTALYRVRGGMTHVSTMLSGDDDVNIARFHPDPGYGFVYGTKQGRVRVLSPRPWNYYNC